MADEPHEDASIVRTAHLNSPNAFLDGPPFRVNLEPCPFHGDKVVGEWKGQPVHARPVIEALIISEDHQPYRVICYGCQAMVYAETAEEALDKWNKRSGRQGDRLMLEKITRFLEAWWQKSTPDDLKMQAADLRQYLRSSADDRDLQGPAVATELERGSQEVDSASDIVRPEP